jgi:hypothetical protein
MTDHSHSCEHLADYPDPDDHCEWNGTWDRAGKAVTRGCTAWADVAYFVRFKPLGPKVLVFSACHEHGRRLLLDLQAEGFTFVTMAERL